MLELHSIFMGTNAQAANFIIDFPAGTESGGEEWMEPWCLLWANPSGITRKSFSGIIDLFVSGVV